MENKNKTDKIQEIENELLAYTPVIDIPYESFHDVAEAVCNLGYRKQSDVIKEFIEKLFSYAPKFSDTLEERTKDSKNKSIHLIKSYYITKQWVENAIQIAKDYDVEIENH